MELTITIRVVHLFIGLLLLWALFYISVRAFLLDNLRQELFAIRDDLFDFAVDGGIRFDNPCYASVRNDINSLIRFAEKLSFTRFLFAEFAPSFDEVTASSVELHRSIDALDLGPRRKLLEAREASLHLVLAYIVRRSLTLLVVVSLSRLVGLWVGAVRSFNQRWIRLAESLGAQARKEFDLAA